MALGDDTGWHGVGWHQDSNCRADPNCYMQTPHMEGLVANGIELDQHYTYRFCSPTRSALMTGRLPIHVNQQNSAEYPWTAAAMHPNFTTVADVLRSRAGYSTHQFGKWHLGLAKPEFTPLGRGFDSHLGYLSGSERHFTHMKGAEECQTGPNNCTATCAVDFWGDSSPGVGFDGMYSVNVYTNAAIQVIEESAQPDSKPFFIYLAFANTHEPLEAPQNFIDKYPKTMQCDSRMMLGAMISAMDEGINNITMALKRTNQWNNTLFVWVSDNGGPDGVGQSGPKAASCAANNFPLRGGKGTAFQGGVRTAGFVSGGLIPQHVRGTKFTGYIHVADWFATFATVAGIPGAAAADDKTAPRPSDSISMWEALIGNTSAKTRTEMPLTISMFGSPAHPGVRIESGAIIIDNLKFILGYIGPGKHFDPYYPSNDSRPAADDPGCPPPGCLYDIIADPEERNDLAKSRPADLARLTKALNSYIPTLFQSDLVSDNNGTYDCQGCLLKARGAYKVETGKPWFGPWL